AASLLIKAIKSPYCLVVQLSNDAGSTASVSSPNCLLKYALHALFAVSWTSGVMDEFFSMYSSSKNFCRPRKMICARCLAHIQNTVIMGAQSCLVVHIRHILHKMHVEAKV